MQGYLPPPLMGLSRCARAPKYFFYSLMPRDQTSHMGKTENPRQYAWYKRELYRINEQPREKPKVDWWSYIPDTLEEWTEITTCMNILAGDPTLENQTSKMRRRLEKTDLIRRHQGSWSYYLTDKALFLYERAISGDYPQMPEASS